MNDSDYMKLALNLATKGAGWTAPNPLVGAVIVKDGRVIGEGFHARYGEAHAERNALADCNEDPRGATMYVTLEPCCHYGKQPPCTEAILAAGISRVVVASGDPNPLVAGKGIEILRAHGVAVTTGVCEAEADAINAIFFHYMRTKTPYVVMKYAMTADGKIATATGASKWITGEAARRHVAETRHRLSAIMVGVGTVLADDPLLTCRIQGGKNPLRIICDSHLRTPPEARVVTTAADVPTLIATCKADSARRAALEAAGCEVLTVPEKDGRIDLAVLMTILGARGIDSVLLEGGGTLNWSALEAGIVQRVQCYVAPKIFGGAAAKSPVEGAGVGWPDDAFRLTNSRITTLGEDILIESEVASHVHGNR